LLVDDGMRRAGGWPAAFNSRFRGNVGAGGVRPLRTLLGLLLVLLATVAGELRPHYITDTHVALMYLLAVLTVAVRFGLWPALITAVASVAALDFFFLPPLFSFTIDTPEDALLLAFFAVVAVTASSLASRLREQMLIAQRHADATFELYRFAEQLAATVTVDAAISAVVAQVETMLGCHASVSLGSAASARLPDLALPLRAAGETVGVMIVTPATRKGFSPGDLRLVDALAELAGIAIGRQLLADRLARLGIEQEADRLRSVLLSSIAHDLTAPISSIASALAALKSGYQTFDDAGRLDLIGEAEREAEHLYRFSSNLVHMTRLEAGALRVQRERVEIGDLVGSALVRARGVLAPRRVVVDIPPGLPWPELDFVLMEQVVFNLLENAGRYTPADATVTIAAEAVEGGVALRIADNGPGFPAEDSERIFAKFYRAQCTSAVSRGTGLGLAICRGFVEAHGGTITAANRADRRGAVFTIIIRDAARPPAAPKGVESCTDQKRCEMPT
jgi:two-component system, OmpR family, sensor histidine kinase KdpD